MPDKNSAMPAQSYPAAFEQPADQTAVSSAFGATATLPRVTPEILPMALTPRAPAPTAPTQNTPQPSSTQSVTGVKTPAVTPQSLLTAAPFPQVVPIINPEQISDPALRKKLTPQATSGKPQVATSAFESALDSADAAADEENPFGAASTLAIGVQEDSATGTRTPVYPSVSPQTQNIPTQEYKKPQDSRNRWGSSFKSFVSSQQAMTQPIRGVARAAQRQFTMAAQRHRAQYVQEKEQAREVLNFTVRLAETMFHYGADTMDVDSAIVTICATYGLDDVEVNVTNQSVIVNYVSDPSDTGVLGAHSRSATESSERFSHTVVRVVRSSSDNYFALDSIYKLIHQITEEGLDRHTASKRLRQINSSKKLYSPMVLTLANMGIVGAFTLGMGGSWRATLCATLIALVAIVSMNWAGKLNLPRFFSMAVGSGAITAGALSVAHDSSITHQLGFYVSAPHIVAAGLLLLVPTSSLVSAAQDAMTGYPLTAAGKFVSTGISFLGLVVGIAGALTVMSYFDIASIDIQQTVFNPPPLWVSIAGMIAGSVAVVAVSQGSAANMLWVVIVSGVGQAFYHGSTALTHLPGGQFNTALAAFAMGAVSALIANKVRSPQISLYIPSIMFLLPGLSIFRGLYAVVMDPNPTAGLVSLVTAFTTIIALASGVVLGAYLMQYALQRMVSSPTKFEQEIQPLDR